MTKDQIKAELRRSATEDVDPWYGVSYDAYTKAFEYTGNHEFILYLRDYAMRTFFLLVAEAL